MPESLDLAEVRATWLRQCGPCDYGLVEHGCTCPPGDYRPVLLRAVDELEQARRDRDDAKAALAQVRALHQQYRTPWTDEFDCCAHCNQIADHLVRWQCDTIRALNGEAADRAAAPVGTGNRALDDQPPTPDQSEVDRG